jgi:hypothetical protein
MDWTWGAEEYDDEGEPSLDYMEYLARRASCSVLPDPPKAMVFLLLLLLFFVLLRLLFHFMPSGLRTRCVLALQIVKAPRDAFSLHCTLG